MKGRPIDQVDKIRKISMIRPSSYKKFVKKMTDLIEGTNKDPKYFFFSIRIIEYPISIDSDLNEHMIILTSNKRTLLLLDGDSSNLFT